MKQNGQSRNEWSKLDLRREFEQVKGSPVVTILKYFIVI
jgi:hypothetical protein